MANQQTPFTAQEPSATGLQDRTVEDKIRHILPANSPLLALVAEGKVENGEMKSSPGLISKKPTATPRFEAFSHTAPDITKVAGAVSSLTVTFDDVTDIHVRMIFENTANHTVGVVDAISGSDVTFVSIGAGDTFSVTLGDTLLNIGVAYEENSSDPAYVQKTDDNIYNLTQIFRYPTAISGTQDNTKQLAGGDFFQRMKKYKMIEAKRAIERALLFGKRASSGNKTTFTQLGVSATTTQGLWNFATNEYDAGGNFTPTKMFKNIPEEMDSSVSDNDKVIMITSKKQRSNILEWPQSAIRIDQSKEYMKTGVKAHTIVTGGADIEVISHDAFNNAGHQDEALLIVPDRLTYRYLQNRDLKPVMGIQSNSTDGTVDEFMGEIGMLPDDGGVSILKVVNMG